MGADRVRPLLQVDDVACPRAGVHRRLDARVGIRPGDLVIAIDGRTIQRIEDFREAMRSYDPENGIRMRVERDGVQRFVFLKNR